MGFCYLLDVDFLDTDWAYYYCCYGLMLGVKVLIDDEFLLDDLREFTDTISFIDFFFSDFFFSDLLFTYYSISDLTVYLIQFSSFFYFSSLTLFSSYIFSFSNALLLIH